MKRNISALLVFTLLPLIFTACNPDTQTDSTTGSAQTAASSPQTENTQDSAAQSGGTQANVSDTQTQTLQPGETASDTAQAETAESTEMSQALSQTDTTPPVSAKPETKEQIVAYFNQAANRVKTEKPGYSRTDATIIGEITLENKVLGYVVPKIVGLFPQGEEEKPGVKKGEDHTDFPVSGEAWSSKLEAAAVQSAQCEEQGAYYVITIRMAPESLAELPRNSAATNHGKLFNTLSYAQIMTEIQKIPSRLAVLEEFKPRYSGSYVTCKVEKDSGRMKEIFYSHPIQMDVKGKVVSVPLVGVAHITLTQDFKINR